MLKKFSQEKYEEGKKQEYLDRKQESGEDTNEYYTDNKRLWIQAYAPSKRSLVWIQGWNAHGTVWCRVEGNMPVLYASEAKEGKEDWGSILDRQLSRNIKKLKTTYTDSFETAENRKRADEMWETGKIPMEVNTMTRIIVYETNDEIPSLATSVNMSIPVLWLA